MIQDKLITEENPKIQFLKCNLWMLNMAFSKCAKYFIFLWEIIFENARNIGLLPPKLA